MIAPLRGVNRLGKEEGDQVSLTATGSVPAACMQQQLRSRVVAFVQFADRRVSELVCNFLFCHVRGKHNARLEKKRTTRKKENRMAENESYSWSSFQRNSANGQDYSLSEPISVSERGM